jgi:hypothetical protein
MGPIEERSDALVDLLEKDNAQADPTSLSGKADTAE